MPYTTYKALPLDTVYDLLVISVRDLLSALDANHDREIAVKALKKQIEVLLELIDQKKTIIKTS